MTIEKKGRPSGVSAADVVLGYMHDHGIIPSEAPSTPSPDKVPTKLDSRTYHYCDDCGEMVSGRHECSKPRKPEGRNA